MFPSTPTLPDPGVLTRSPIRYRPYWETVYQCWSYWSYDRVPLLALVCSRKCVESVMVTPSNVRDKRLSFVGKGLKI
jgi:hypothetical protein